ncbi:hypothetical protein Dimus_030696, partial [Dionaea muscipula]
FVGGSRIDARRGAEVTASDGRPLDPRCGCNSRNKGDGISDELNNAGIDRISPELGLIEARMAWVTGAIELIDIARGCRWCADPWWHRRALAVTPTPLWTPQRFGPYFCQPAIAGLGAEDKPFICTMDSIGAKELAKDFLVAGTSSESLYGACDAMFKPDMVCANILTVPRL